MYIHIHIHIYMCTYIYIYIYTYVCVYMRIYIYTWLSIYLSIYRSIYLSIYPSICLEAAEVRPAEGAGLLEDVVRIPSLLPDCSININIMCYLYYLQFYVLLPICVLR